MARWTGTTTQRGYGNTHQRERERRLSMAIGSIPFEVTVHTDSQPFAVPEWEEITIPQAVIAAAARAIEASTVFRKNFKPQWHKDIHSEALKLASAALYAAARQQHNPPDG